MKKRRNRSASQTITPPVFQTEPPARFLRNVSFFSYECSFQTPQLKREFCVCVCVCVCVLTTVQDTVRPCLSAALNWPLIRRRKEKNSVEIQCHEMNRWVRVVFDEFANKKNEGNHGKLLETRKSNDIHASPTNWLVIPNFLKTKSNVNRYEYIGCHLIRCRIGRSSRALATNKPNQKTIENWWKKTSCENCCNGYEWMGSKFDVS